MCRYCGPAPGEKSEAFTWTVTSASADSDSPFAVIMMKTNLSNAISCAAAIPWFRQVKLARCRRTCSLCSQILVGGELLSSLQELLGSSVGLKKSVNERAMVNPRLRLPVSASP